MRIFALMACLVLCCAGVFPAEASNTVDIKAEAVFTGRSLRLADVAAVTGPDAGVLSQIVLTEMPRGSSGLIISGKVIREKIRRHYQGAVVFSGASSVHALPGTVEVPEEVLRKAFIEAVHRNSPWKEAGTIEVRDIRVSRLPRVLPADSNTIQAKFSSRTNFLGFTTATLYVGAGPSPERVTVTGRVKLMADIPVARTRVPSGTILTPGDFEVRTVDISGTPDVCMRLEDCAGRRARVTLRQGNPVQLSQIERVPDVCSGAHVTIQALAGNIMVEARGVAIRDGRFGENIPVKNLSSGKQVVGTIIAPSIVQVAL